MADGDGDGILDASDDCPSTPLGELVGDDGCAVCPCDAAADGTPWESRLAYMHCVRTEARAQLDAGWLTAAEERWVLRSAHLSTCGRSERIRCCSYAEGDETRPPRTKCRVTTPSRCVPRSARVEWTENLDTGSCVPNPCVLPE